MKGSVKNDAFRRRGGVSSNIQRGRVGSGLLRVGVVWSRGSGMVDCGCRGSSMTLDKRVSFR